MSILIKGMEMPKCCDDCWALDEYGDYPRCRITEEQRGYNFRIREQRMEHCPLIEVPTPHGRLIDADALKVERPIMDGSITVGVSYAITRKEIDEAPTVIEAEK